MIKAVIFDIDGTLVDSVDLHAQAWKEAALVMDQLRRLELRGLDAKQAVGLLCGPADYHSAPRAPRHRDPAPV